MDDPYGDDGGKTMSLRSIDGDPRGDGMGEPYGDGSGEAMSCKFAVLGRICNPGSLLAAPISAAMAK